MKIPKRFQWMGGVASVMAFCALTACNLQQTQGVDSSVEVTNDRFHEKSFSWDNPAGKLAMNGALAKTQSTATQFKTMEALQQAVREMDEALKNPAVADSLWKPIDYACDELALGLWNKYGTITVGDSVVLDEASLKKSCRYVGDDAVLGKSAKAAVTVYPSEAIDRQYPYKMIGNSWDNFNAVVYKSTGGETQFKKDRKIWGVQGWYDLDATRIGIRIYVIDCPAFGPENCWIRTSSSDWDKNDDYVSSRDFGIGIKGGVRVGDAVISMHSVDHAGLQFRATSSSGLNSTTTILNPANYGYVTW